MLLGKEFERFLARAPICVATRGLMESALNAELLDALFNRTADSRYQKELLFSTCVDLMGSVVCRTSRSLNAAYQASPGEIAVSIQSVYGKIARIETETSAELVRHAVGRLASAIGSMKGSLPALAPGYRVKMLDGNHLTKTHRRLKALRDVAAGPLPGQTLVVFDPSLDLVIDVVPCEDGHARERSLMRPVLNTVAARDLWVADRNFCTTGILFGISERSGFFAIRQHASTLSWEKEGEKVAAGRCETGKLSEQEIWLEDGEGKTLKVRRVTLALDEPTRDGETEIHAMTNLPPEVDAAAVMELYRKRWRIEGVFQDLTVILKCGANSLGYPKAALFGFCVALVSRNIFSTVKAALRAAHGTKKVEGEVSNYFPANEISGTYQGMMIALPPEAWEPLSVCDDATLAEWLLEVVRKANLKRYKKTVRGPKKPWKRPMRFASDKHVSTAKLLADEKIKKRHL